MVDDFFRFFNLEGLFRSKTAADQFYLIFFVISAVKKADSQKFMNFASHQLVILCRLFNFRAFLISMTILSPKETLLPKRYELYGVKAVPGEPGILKERSKVIIFSEGGPAVMAVCRAKGPIIRGGEISRAALSIFSAASKAFSNKDSFTVTLIWPDSIYEGLFFSINFICQTEGRRIRPSKFVCLLVSVPNNSRRFSKGE